MAIKILFINSPLEIYPLAGRSVSYDCMPPYGLLYCATVCSNILGAESVSVIDAEYWGLSPQQIISTVEDLSPEFIAINVTSVNYLVVREIISLIQKPKTVIVGGTHAILSPNDFFDSTIQDKILFVCNGAGESVYHQFFTGTPIERISNISYFDGEKIVKNKDTINYAIDNLIVSRDLLPYDPNTWRNSNTVESYMVTSRGCAYMCSFCAANVICENKVILRSSKALIEEFIYLKNRGVNYIRFVDDLFMSSINRLLLICDCIKSVGWNCSNFGFEATGRIDILSKANNRVWEILTQSGCKELEIGVESGSDKVLKQMNKKYRADQLLSVIQKAVTFKIKIKAFIICGYIGETFDDLLATLNLCKYLKEIAGDLIRFSAVPAKAYPKTVLYDQLINLPCLRDTEKNWLYQTENVNLTEFFQFDNEAVKSTLSARTRYNGMHIYKGKPTSLSEVSGGAQTSTVLKVLSDIALISDNLDSFFF